MMPEIEVPGRLQTAKRPETRARRLETFEVHP